MKKNNILYFIILSFLFSKNIDANENNKKKTSINCIDENLNPCSSLEISKDKSDKKIIVNNLSPFITIPPMKMFCQGIPMF